MATTTSQILQVLAEYGITPLGSDPRDGEFTSEIDESESVFEIDLNDILGKEDSSDNDDHKLGDFDPFEALDEYLREMRGRDDYAGRDVSGPFDSQSISGRIPEPYCAWYCPIHFYGPDWGIYIRETCVIRQAYGIASFTRGRPKGNKWKFAERVFRASFFAFYLHEQFHHKVESLGLRLLVASGADKYRPYQVNVYAPNYNSLNCIEESLANADSVRRLSEPRYSRRLGPTVLGALGDFLRHTIPLQPYSYGLGLKFVDDQPNEDGLWELQSQVLTGTFPTGFPSHRWSVARQMIRSAMDIDRTIYAILPRGARPILPWGHIKPAPTVSSRDFISASRKYYGFEEVPGGKGSHVKLKHSDGRTLIIPGDRKDLRPGTLRNSLETLGRFELRQLPEVLSGKARSRARG